MITNYKDLNVWKKAYTLTLDVYKATLCFPQHELFGLTAQLRRCSLSIVSNIAEGYYRWSSKEYARFLGISRASCAELETQISIAKDLGYIKRDDYLKISKLIDDISKMLFSLKNKLY